MKSRRRKYRMRYRKKLTNKFRMYQRDEEGNSRTNFQGEMKKEFKDKFSRTDQGGAKYNKLNTRSRRR